MYKLGYTFDLAADVLPVDLSAAANTGLRINLRQVQNANLVLVKQACTGAGTDPVLTINQWQAKSGGTAAVYSADHFFKKSAVGFTGTPAVPATTVAVTNASNDVVQVVITGGTMTAVVVNGTTVGAGAGTYLVPAGGTISMTYSAAPTWTWTALLGNTETWTLVNNTSDGNPYNPPTNTLNSTVTLTGENQKQGIYVVELNVKNILDGYDYVSVDVAKAGTVAQIASLSWVLADLVTRRGPLNMPATLY